MGSAAHQTGRIAALLERRRQFEKKIKPKCRGEAYLLRFADDFVVSFQFRQDVDHFQQKVRERFADFGRIFLP